MKTALILNIIIFIFVAVAAIWMMTESSSFDLEASRLGALKYFTVDSNILMGISAIVMACAQIQVLEGKKGSVATGLYVFKLIGTVGVTITMLVTVFYLGFVVSGGFFSLFRRANFIFHLVVPVLSLVVFLGFERTQAVPFKCNFFSLIPIVLYGIYYGATAYAHMENGVVAPGYDWYRFLRFGSASALIILPIFLGFAFLVSFVLWKLNSSGF